MRLVNINMVRDVSDVIELWFRHHKDIFDHFYIIDNNSSDATPQIIQKLIDEGFPITLTTDSNISYEEGPVISKRLWSVADQSDWFLFLDADEFLNVNKGTVLATLNDVQPNFVPKLKWRTWIPTQLDFQHNLTNFRPLKEEHGMFKVAIDKRRAPRSKLDMGTHDISDRVLNDDKKRASYFSGLIINHFPVRSPDQLLSKVILFNHIFELRKRIFPNTVTISQTLYKNLKARNFTLDLEAMQEIAGKYNLNGKVETTDEVFQSLAALQYPELAKINTIASLAKELELYSKYISINHK